MGEGGSAPLQQGLHDWTTRSLPSPPRPVVNPAHPKEPHAAPAHNLTLFREQAIKAYLEGEPLAPLLEVAPLATRFLLLGALGLIAAAIAVCVVVKVDVVARGRGVLQPAEVQLMTSPVAGLVEAITVSPGQQVAAGDVILRIASAPAQSELLEAQRLVTSVEGREKELFEENVALQERRVRAINARVAQQQRRVFLQGQRLKRLAQVQKRTAAGVRAGVLPANQLDIVADQIELARQEEAALAEGVVVAQLDLNELKQHQAEALATREVTVRRASARLEAAQRVAADGAVRAPGSGVIESLTVKPGQFMAPGQLYAQLVPLGAPRNAVVFVPAKDRAFLREGSPAAIELDQLSHWEFGRVNALVKRISTSIVSSDEVSLTMGDTTHANEPAYRVELSVVPDAVSARLIPMVRNGTQLSARFALRQRRMASLLFEPLRRWLE